MLSAKHDKQKRFNSQIKDERKGGKVVRVQNFQALVDDSYTHVSDFRLQQLGKLDNPSHDINQGREPTQSLNLHLNVTSEQSAARRQANKSDSAPVIVK